MPDLRDRLMPWIIAGFVLLILAGAWILWITRPRASYTARSLSASNHPAQPVTKSLHVDGCKDDFIVSPGELVEPLAVPGDPLDHFRAIYGPEKDDKEARLEKAKYLLSWDQEAFSLTYGYPGKPENFVSVSVKPGHVVETLDGIELGQDSFGTLFLKMSDRKVEIHERIDHAGGNWKLIVSFYSACGRKFRSEYIRTLPGSSELDKLIAPPPSTPNGSAQPATGLWRSSVFMNKVVSDYTILPSGGQDTSTDGSPSEHD